MPIFGVLESTILTSPARVIDHYHSSHSSTKATSRQQGTPPKTGPRSPLHNLLRALFSKYVHSMPTTVAMTSLVPQLEPVPGLLWVINTLDEWPHVYCQYYPVPLAQQRMMSETPTTQGEYPMAKGESPRMSPITQPMMTPFPTNVYQSFVLSDWLIVMLLSYTGNFPYLLVYYQCCLYHPVAPVQCSAVCWNPCCTPVQSFSLLCTKPTDLVYTVLTCSWLHSKAIDSKDGFQCDKPNLECHPQPTSLSPSCPWCPDVFLMVIMFWSVCHPLLQLYGGLLLSSKSHVFPPISLLQSCMIECCVTESHQRGVTWPKIWSGQVLLSCPAGLPCF